MQLTKAARLLKDTKTPASEEKKKFRALRNEDECLGVYAHVTELVWAVVCHTARGGTRLDKRYLDIEIYII